MYQLVESEYNCRNSYRLITEICTAFSHKNNVTLSKIKQILFTAINYCREVLRLQDLHMLWKSNADWKVEKKKAYLQNVGSL